MGYRCRWGINGGRDDDGAVLLYSCCKFIMPQRNYSTKKQIKKPRSLGAQYFIRHPDQMSRPEF